MTFTKLLNKINDLIMSKPQVPKCFEDGNYIYCWCGKCKQKDYPLPDDFAIELAHSAAEYYRKFLSTQPSQE